ncbi:MAG: restriction endonuclease subunit R, partial [Lentisphaerae bacterium]|nr:restriction endonuclease subunit R [Lentisphaerota bacterium]
ALSVDMLDTGIDVPEVVNLVFFKLVRSKTKFWQMLGRGTRLCPDLFGPDQDKQFFCLFDYCQNLEYFSQNPETTDGPQNEPLGRRIFTARLELIGELDKRAFGPGVDPLLHDEIANYKDPANEADVRQSLGNQLVREVAAMNIDNFQVRPRRRLVEKYADPKAWRVLPPAALSELAQEVAGLPAELAAEDEEAKRFDLLMLNLQLARLRSEPGFERLRDKVKAIAGLLEEKSAIPMVRDQMRLIEEVQADEWWQDVTIPMLEIVRRRLRDLVKLIEKARRKPIYTDFEDELGDEMPIVLPGLGEGPDFAKFRAKATVYLRAHQNHIVIHKLRTNTSLTAADLAELERLLAESGIGKTEDIERAKADSQGLGLFVRSLVGMDRQAAKDALAGFLAGKTLAGNQIDFVNLIIEHLTRHGAMEPALLYESPFTDLTPQGPEGLFNAPQVDELIAVLDTIRRTATAA